MGQIVYGLNVEPAGMVLDDVEFNGYCPKCMALGASFRYWDSSHGGAINQHWSVYCDACGYSNGYDDDEGI